MADHIATTENKKLSVWDLLRKKYPENEYALMSEVRDKAGHSASRSADYIVVNLWPSRGLSVIGIELKSFRSDWLSELKKPQKAENIFQYCDNWYLLTTDESVAKIEEIPPTWGWLVCKGASIRVMKEAPKLSPVPISRNFLVCMLKRAQDKTDFVHVSTIQNHIDAKVQTAVNKATNDNRYAVDNAKELIKTVQEFETASGIKITNRWGEDSKKIGETVRLILDHGIDDYKKQLERMKLTAENFLKGLNETIEKANS